MCVCLVAAVSVVNNKHLQVCTQQVVRDPGATVNPFNMDTTKQTALQRCYGQRD